MQFNGDVRDRGRTQRFRSKQRSHLNGQKADQLTVNYSPPDEFISKVWLIRSFRNETIKLVKFKSKFSSGVYFAVVVWNRKQKQNNKEDPCAEKKL